MARTIAKDHDEKRRRILKIAAEVFARDGIARTSMSTVAKSCGISKANIYHYYTSKDELVFDILDQYLGDLRDWVYAIDLSNLSPQEQFQRVTSEFLLAYEGMDHEHKIQGEGLPALSTAQQEVLKNYQRELVRLVSDILCRCAPDKFVHDKAALRDTTMSVFGILNWYYMWNPLASLDERISYAKLTSELILNGISGKPTLD